MDLVTSNFMPGDPRLIDQIVYELKSQGIFDQFRKECIADVDTKPAYQNLSQRVEGNVMNFLRKQRFSEDMNKNQLREQLRKNISESGFLETGVERIVDQVVNPKINTIFLPKVEDVVYRYLGIKKPNEDVEEDIKIKAEDLLPNDLEAISPESVNDHSLNLTTEKKDDSIETNENSLNSSNTKTEDESPPFELLEENTKFSMHEENSVDSHLSGISGLASHDSQNVEIKTAPSVDMTQDISQNSMYSEGNLSIVTSEDDIKMEICEDSNISDGKDLKADNNTSKDNDETQKIAIDTQTSIIIEEKDKEPEETNGSDIKNDEKNEIENKKSEEKKVYENKSNSKKSHDKHKSSRSEKDRKEDKEKKSRSRSKSESKHKDHKDSKSSSKHNSSKEKNKDKERDKKEIKNIKDKIDGTEKHKDKIDSSEKHKDVKKEDKERDRSKDKSSKTKEKSEKDRDRTNKEKEKTIKDKEVLDKEKINKDKSGKAKVDKEKEKQKTEKEKGKSDKEKEIKSEKEKGKAERDKDKSDRDKTERGKSSLSKHSKEKSSSSETKKYNKEKEKSKDQVSTNNKNKVSLSKEKDVTKGPKDKDRSKSSSSNSRDKDKDKEKKSSGDHKSRSGDKYKKSEKDKTTHHERSISSKKDKDKKHTDDHYSLKDKKSERRSTDRDSNDGSGKGTSRNGSFTDSFSQSIKGSSKGSSEVFSSGSGDSSNSDKVEKDLIEQKNEVAADPVKMEAMPVIKYIKPKFASNIHEAMKIMKIRKQLAKLERQNQLGLTQVKTVKSDQSKIAASHQLKELTVVLEKNTLLSTNAVNNIEDIKNGQKIENILEEEANLSTKLATTEKSPLLKSQDLSMESFEALEARLAQEMSNINCNMYGDEDGCEYSSVSFTPGKKRKISNDTKPNLKKVLFDTSNDNIDKTEIELVVSEQEKLMPEQINTVNNRDVTIFIEDQQGESDCNKSIASDSGLHREEIIKFNDKTITEIINTNEQLTLKEVENHHAIIINKSTEVEVGNDIVANKELSKKIQEEPKENIQYKKETNSLKQRDDFKDADNKDVCSEMEGFKGFSSDDRNNLEVIKFVQKVTELENNYNNAKRLYAINENKNSLNTKVESKANCQNKGDTFMLKHGLSLEATLKEVTIMSSTIQDLLQRNGKKMSIKIDNLKPKVPTKVLVGFQGMEATRIEKNNAGQKLEVDQKEMKRYCEEDKTHFQKEDQFVKSKPGVLPQYSDDEGPCFYFDQSDCSSKKHLKVLNDRIERLEKELKEKSIQVQKAAPVLKKRGRKRKAEGTENNNGIASKLKPDLPKKRLLSDSKVNQSIGSLCNTNVTTNQSFILPLSPAESDKSEEHRKEEPLTVKTKRTGRVSNSKRYSSEDLYKPRPILSCTRSRRRGAKLEQDKT